MAKKKEVIKKTTWMFSDKFLDSNVLCPYCKKGMDVGKIIDDAEHKCKTCGKVFKVSLELIQYIHVYSKLEDSNERINSACDKCEQKQPDEAVPDN